MLAIATSASPPPTQINSVELLDRGTRDLRESDCPLWWADSLLASEESIYTGSSGGASTETKVSGKKPLKRVAAELL